MYTDEKRTNQVEHSLGTRLVEAQRELQQSTFVLRLCPQSLVVIDLGCHAIYTMQSYVLSHMKQLLPVLSIWCLGV